MKTKSAHRWTNKIALVATYVRLVHEQTRSPTRAARFFVRSIFYWPATTDWLAFIESHPVLARAPDEIKRGLADKIHRPFARRGLGVAARAALLTHHYTCMTAHLLPDVLLEMVCGRKFPLARLRGRDQANVYTIRISRNVYLQHQGELTVKLLDPAKKMALAHLIVNITRDRVGRRVVLISGMQGPGPAHKAAIVLATRDLSGLRPKRAVLEAVCSLARWLDAAYIVAVGKSNHVSQTKRKWRNKIFADYDGFWREFAPVAMEDGNYKLPVSLPRRHPEDVAGRKRKEWRGRCAYMDAIAVDVAESLAALSGIMEPEKVRPHDLRIDA